MTTFAGLLMAYNLEIEWLLTWFPIRQTANLDAVRMRGGTFTHSNTEFGPQIVRQVGQGFIGEGDPLGKDLVGAFIGIGVTPDKVFTAELEV